MKTVRVFWKRHLHFFREIGIYFFKFNLLGFVRSYITFIKEFRTFLSQRSNPNFEKLMWYPCLFDNTGITPVDPVYFYQDTWAAKMIFNLKPSHHYDIGSAYKTIGIISQFTPVTMIDIRPIDLELSGLSFIEGNILELPFEDKSLESLSSLCVVEHIGLGRYGDKIDSFGSEKAIKELKRVIKYNGVILISLPVDSENRVYFNAHRAFTRDYIIQLFAGFDVIEEKYQYGNMLYDLYDPKKGFGTGLYAFRKVQNVY